MSVAELEGRRQRKRGRSWRKVAQGVGAVNSGVGCEFPGDFGIRMFVPRLKPASRFATMQSIIRFMMAGVLAFNAGCGMFGSRDGADTGASSSGQEDVSSTSSNAPKRSDSAKAGARVSSSSEQGNRAVLSFRAIILDENQNQLIHGGEPISVELEVTNEGPGAASGVEVLVSGTAELVEQIPAIVPVGDIPPGETKRVSLGGKSGAVRQSIQADLYLALHTQSPLDQLPMAKKFVIAMSPGTPSAAPAVPPVNVEAFTKQMGKLKQPNAVGVAIGVGQFRDGSLPRAKYAARDAETMAAHWNAIGGIPSERILRLVDSHALKNDLAETFEEWLPKQVDSTTVVYVYVSGRGVVEASSGSVYLLPFDGALSSVSRVFALKRIHEALEKLSVSRAIVMLDLSLQLVAKKEGEEPALPRWQPGDQGNGNGNVMWMIGNRAVQDAHQYDAAQHGLFTYELLKGWGGAADTDKDGAISAGELCAHVKSQVMAVAREQFGNEQEPLCLPGPGQRAAVRLHTMAKFK